MNRRNACIALSALTSVLALRVGAQPARPIRVAWVTIDHASTDSPLVAAFRAGMADLGYVEGRNLAIDLWWGEGSGERLERMAGDILRTNPDVLVTQGGSALPPMLRAGVKKPIVFSLSADPVLAKFAESYARPGGNVTGITLFDAQLAGKRLELMKEAVPSIERVAIIANPQHPGEERESGNARAAAVRLGLTADRFPVRTEAELEAAFAKMAGARITGALTLADGFSASHAGRVASLAIGHRIAVVSGWSNFAQSGMLMTYGPVFADVYRRLAGYVDRIHKGARPADMPIEQPTLLELVINTKTANALRLTLPPSLLQRADRVIG